MTGARIEPSPTSPEEMPPSDAERQAVADRLRDAVGAGLLPFEELETRIDMAYEAKTLADLEKLVRWLPPQEATAPANRARTGRARAPWIVGAGLTAVVLTGVLVTIGSRHNAPSQSTSTPARVATPSPTSPSPSYGSSQAGPAPSVVGTFCSSMAANQAQNPGDNPAGITPKANFWGNQPVPAGVNTKDLAAVTTANAATFVILQAWQANGHQYQGLSIACLNDYDPTFRFVNAGVASSGHATVSATFESQHSLLAVLSATGRCWYALNVMNGDDPIIAKDDLGSYGSYYATRTAHGCSAQDPPGYGLWQRADPFPPQLQAQ